MPSDYRFRFLNAVCSLNEHSTGVPSVGIWHVDEEIAELVVPLVILRRTLANFSVKH